MQRVRLTIVCAAALLGVATLQSSARDLFPAPWETNPSDPTYAGGQTTYQRWEFDGSTGPATQTPFGLEPTSLHNPFGTPTITWQDSHWPDPVPGPDGTTIIPTWHVDVDGGGFILVIPNNPPDWPVKYIQVQVTSDKATLNNEPPTGAESLPGGRVVQWPGPGWYTYEYLLTIRPNPPIETLHFVYPASTNIEEIVVKTICVPEPSLVTIAAIAIAGASTLARRRRTT